MKRLLILTAAILVFGAASFSPRKVEARMEACPDACASILIQCYAVTGAIESCNAAYKDCLNYCDTIIE